MTLRQLENRLDPQRFVIDLNKAIGKSLGKEALDIAKKHSSGMITTAQQRKEGHPYRRGGPNPYDPGTINVQSGRFRSAWRLEYRGGYLCLINESPEADFMKGTRRMVERPIWKNIERDLAPRINSVIMDQQERYWSK